MKTFLQAQDLWEIVQEGLIISENLAGLSADDKKKLKEEQQQNSVALCFLQQAVNKAIFSRIRNVSSAKEVWDKLEQKSHGDTKVRTIILQSLRKQYANIKMKDFETVKNFYTRIMALVTEMRAYGEDLTDKKIVEKILISLTAKFTPMPQ